MKYISQICEVIAAIYTVTTILGLITPSNNKNTKMSKVGRFFDKVGLNLKGLFKK